MKIRVHLTLEIPSFGGGVRVVEFVAASEKDVLLKKGKRKKVVSKRVFEKIYIDDIPLEKLYAIETEFRKPTVRVVDKRQRERQRVYQELRKITSHGTISKDILDGVINSRKGTTIKEKVLK